MCCGLVVALLLGLFSLICSFLCFACVLVFVLLVASLAIV